MRWLSVLFVFVVAPVEAREWQYHQDRKSIYAIIEREDEFGSPFFVSAEVNADKVIFTALVTQAEHRKYFVTNPPVLFRHEGQPLVKNEQFLLGKVGSPVSIKVDGQEFSSFILRPNRYEITLTSGDRDAIVAAMVRGKSLKLLKHYWIGEQKHYPVFSLLGFTATYDAHAETIGGGIEKTFPLSGLFCMDTGRRRAVWIRTSHGVYALNGPAITAFAELNDRTDAEGRPFKLGPDLIDRPLIEELITEGLKRCGK